MSFEAKTIIVERKILHISALRYHVTPPYCDVLYYRNKQSNKYNFKIFFLTKNLWSRIRYKYFNYNIPSATLISTDDPHHLKI